MTKEQRYKSASHALAKIVADAIADDDCCSGILEETLSYVNHVAQYGNANVRAHCTTIIKALESVWQEIDNEFNQ